MFGRECRMYNWGTDAGSLQKPTKGMHATAKARRQDCRNKHANTFSYPIHWAPGKAGFQNFGTCKKLVFGVDTRCCPTLEKTLSRFGNAESQSDT